MVQTEHFTQLNEEETACLCALVEDKLTELEGDKEVPERVMRVLRSIKEKMSGGEGTQAS